MSLFREQAVRQYNDPDERGGLLRVTPPSGLRIFVPLAAFFVLGVALASVQTVHETARGRGVVRPIAGVHIVRAPREGRVDVVVPAGGIVEAGAPLLRIAGPSGAAEAVSAPVAGRVDTLAVRSGDMVTAGMALAKIVPTDGELVGFLAIDAEHRADLAPGDTVRLHLDEQRAEQAGFGRATILRVSDDPVTPELVDPVLARSLGEGPQFLVEIHPDAMPPRAEGDFRNGMTFTGEVVLRERRIISLLLDL